MSNALQQPHEPILHELASEVSRLHDRVEDLEDLRDLLTAENAAQGRPVFRGNKPRRSLISTSRRAFRKQVRSVAPPADPGYDQV